MKRLLVPSLCITTAFFVLAACEPEAQPVKHAQKHPGGFNGSHPTVVEDDADHAGTGEVPPGGTEKHGTTHTETETTTTTAPTKNTPAPTQGNYEYGKPVPGKPGFVTSPYAPYQGYVDVRGYAPGTEVKDPYTGKIFLVPAQ